MAPAAAPIAAPRNGTKNSRPKSSPQNAPPRAPGPARLFSWRVFGFFFPAPQLTVAASWIVISSCFDSDSSVASASSAPVAVSNFQTVSVAIHPP